MHVRDVMVSKPNIFCEPHVAGPGLQEELPKPFWSNSNKGTKTLTEMRSPGQTSTD